MKKILILISCLAITSLVYANQTCVTYPDGTVVCSNPDGSWGNNSSTQTP